MNRACFALSVLFATMTASFMAVGTAKSQTGIEGGLADQDDFVCPMSHTELNQCPWGHFEEPCYGPSVCDVDATPSEQLSEETNLVEHKTTTAASDITIEELKVFEDDLSGLVEPYHVDCDWLREHYGDDFPAGNEIELNNHTAETVVETETVVAEVQLEEPPAPFEAPAETAEIAATEAADQNYESPYDYESYPSYDWDYEGAYGNEFEYESENEPAPPETVVETVEEEAAPEQPIIGETVEAVEAVKEESIETELIETDLSADDFFNEEIVENEPVEVPAVETTEDVVDAEIDNEGYDYGYEYEDDYGQTYEYEEEYGYDDDFESEYAAEVETTEVETTEVETTEVEAVEVEAVEVTTEQYDAEAIDDFGYEADYDFDYGYDEYEATEAADEAVEVEAAEEAVEDEEAAIEAEYDEYYGDEYYEYGDEYYDADYGYAEPAEETTKAAPVWVDNAAEYDQPPADCLGDKANTAETTEAVEAESVPHIEYDWESEYLWQYEAIETDDTSSVETIQSLPHGLGQRVAMAAPRAIVATVHFAQRQLETTLCDGRFRGEIEQGLIVLNKLESSAKLAVRKRRRENRQADVARDQVWRTMASLNVTEPYGSAVATIARAAQNAIATAVMVRVENAASIAQASDTIAR